MKLGENHRIFSSMKWVKGEVLGKGTFGTVYLGKPINPSSRSVPLIAVKSVSVSESSSLHKEGEILRILGNCPEIIRGFGDDLSVENGKGVYNLLLQYASGGTLADLIKISGGKLPESDVRRYTRMILRGLRYIHEKGYAHCDIKPRNILVFPSRDGVSHLKIANFGLAKTCREEGLYIDGNIHHYRGTPLYTSPESVACGEHKAPLDIWSLGCTVVEMVVGKPAWTFRDVDELLYEIAFGEELPLLPEEMSKNGKDFLIRCFQREPYARWTAEMLLNHPYIVEDSTLLPETEKSYPCPSSTSPFDSKWVSLQSLFST